MNHEKTPYALPSKADIQLAKVTSRILAKRASNVKPLSLRLLGGTKADETVVVPAAAVQLLLRILNEMSQGHTVTLLPVQAEVTSQEAADLLNISRPSLIRLLDEGKIEHHKVGTHRRVRLTSLLAFKKQLEADRRSTLAELVAYDQELGLE